MQNRAPPLAQVPGHEIFAYFNPVPDTYADAVEKAGGFAFLAQLSQEKSPF